MKTKLNPYFIPILIFFFVVFAGINFLYNSKQKYFDINNPDNTNSQTTAPQQFSSSTSEWKTYKNEMYGFELSYPPGWWENKLDNYIRSGDGASRMWIKNYKETDGCYETYSRKNKYYNNVQMTIEYLDGVSKFNCSDMGNKMIKAEFELNEKTYNIIMWHDITINDNSDNELFDQILSTFRFVGGADYETLTIKLYYRNGNLPPNPEYDCLTNTFKTVELNTTEENKINDTLNTLIADSEFEHHADFKLLSSRLDNGLLILEFSDIPGFTTGGSCRISKMTDQIVSTAKQFPEVKKVVFEPAVFQP